MNDDRVTEHLPLPNLPLHVLLALAEGERHGWGVITGAGPGIMEAGSKGAGPEHSYGVNIRLPFEDAANPYLRPERTVNFKYFFTRKLGFVKESHAFAIFPGGWGTLDEAFELLTLVQTGKIRDFPIVLMGTDYWRPFVSYLRSSMLARGMVDGDDIDRLVITDSPEEAAGLIRDAAMKRFGLKYQAKRPRRRWLFE